MALAMPAQQACKEKYKWPWQCQHDKLARQLLGEKPWQQSNG